MMTKNIAAVLLFFICEGILAWAAAHYSWRQDERRYGKDCRRCRTSP